MNATLLATPSVPAAGIEPPLIVIPAAGRARRFGADKRAARLAGGDTLLAATLRASAHLSADSRILLRRTDNPLELGLPTHAATIRVSGDGGLGDTLAEGFATLLKAPLAPAVTHAAIWLGDLPWVHAETCGALIQALKEPGAAEAVIRPVRQGQHGFPVLFPRRLWPALATLSGESGGRELLANESVLPVTVADPGILLDVDYPADLSSA